TQRFFHPNLTGALGYGNEHDIHQADAANAESNGADESQQNLQSQEDDAKLRQLCLHVEDTDCPVIAGLEVVGDGQRVADRFSQVCIVQSLGVQPDTTDVVNVLQNIHRVIRDIEHPVVVIPLLLHSRL